MIRLAGFMLLTLSLFSCGVARKSTRIMQADMKSETSETTIDYSEQSTWLLGYFNPLQLKVFPHESWYTEGFNAYQPDSYITGRLVSLIDSGLTITIVMGTWCSDSRREVPRFMKILDNLNFPVERLTFIGVDDVKISPVEEYFSLGIQRVPTFIFYKNKIEAGRIIENPVTSLEQDMENILKGIEN